MPFSATPSDGIGGAAVVPGLGFPISHRGTQSWLNPDHASSLVPGKRPRLTPNPALARRNGRPYMPFGCPGGDAQVQGMLQVFLNIVEFGMDPQSAIEAPRVISHSFPNSFWPHIMLDGVVTVETRIAEEARAALRNKGHILEEDGDWSGAVSRVCAITVVFRGGHSHRRRRPADHGLRRPDGERAFRRFCSHPTLDHGLCANRSAGLATAREHPAGSPARRGWPIPGVG